MDVVPPVVKVLGRIFRLLEGVQKRASTDGSQLDSLTRPSDLIRSVSYFTDLLKISPTRVRLLILYDVHSK